MESALDYIVERGWEYTLRWSNDQATIVLSRPEWATDALGLARICPTLQGNTSLEAVHAAQRFVKLESLNERDMSLIRGDNKRKEGIR